jgi:hypothetical protein
MMNSRHTVSSLLFLVILTSMQIASAQQINGAQGLAAR